MDGQVKPGQDAMVVLALSERCQLAQFLYMRGHGGAFVLQIIRHGGAQARMGNVMGGKSG